MSSYSSFGRDNPRRAEGDLRCQAKAQKVLEGPLGQVSKDKLAREPEAATDHGLLLWLGPSAPRTEQAQARLDSAGTRQGTGPDDLTSGPSCPRGPGRPRAPGLPWREGNKKIISEMTPPCLPQLASQAAPACGTVLGRDSPSCLPDHCPQGVQCLLGIPEGKQRAASLEASSTHTPQGSARGLEPGRTHIWFPSPSIPSWLGCDLGRGLKAL